MFGGIVLLLICSGSTKSNDARFRNHEGRRRRRKLSLHLPAKRRNVVI
jgi:hypothetical protein